jgi:hypothetical protein
MNYGKPITIGCIALTAAGPLLLHGHPERDCSPSIELCPVSYLFSAPDEPAPENAPGMIFAPPVAAYTGSTSVNMWLSSGAWLPAKV